MKVLVTYGSALGSTARMAERIATVLADAGLEVTVLPAAIATDQDDGGGYDAYVIGGGTYAGHWHPDAVSFVRRHAALLAARPVWLFSSGPLGSTPAEAAHEPIEMAEVVALVGAREPVVFAGAFNRATVDGSELGRLERIVARRFIPQGDWRDWPSIEAWARSIALALRPTTVAAR